MSPQGSEGVLLLSGDEGEQGGDEVFGGLHELGDLRCENMVPWMSCRISGITTAAGRIVIVY